MGTPPLSTGGTLPTERDPFVDLLRVAAIVVVVVGHWVTTTIVWTPELVTSVNALEIIPETRPVTWVVQVMPLVFFAGGFANAVSLARAPGVAAYLQTRMRRLLSPTAVFLGIWLAIGLAIELTDPDGPGKVRAAETAALPLWFLGIYVVAVAAAPGMWRLHRLGRWWVVGALAAGVAAVDLAVEAGGLTDLGGLNYALVWLLAHQGGFFYADGTLRRLRPGQAALLAGGGLGALVLLVTVLGYPVSLVGVPGGVPDNAEPPSLAMVAGAVWLVGLVLVLRPGALRWLEPARRRARVRRWHRFLLTVYLWHITALMVSAGLWHAVGLPEPAIGSGAWWGLRPLWVLAALPPLALLSVLLARFEAHPPLPEAAASPSPLVPVSAAFGVFAVSVALLGFGETGFLPLAPLDGEAVLMFDFNPVQNVVHLVAGAAVLATLGREAGNRAAVVAGAVLFIGLGVGHQAGWVDRLGMNGPSAVAHVAVGTLALAGTVAALLPIGRGRR